MKKTSSKPSIPFATSNCLLNDSIISYDLQSKIMYVGTKKDLIDVVRIVVNGDKIIEIK